MSLKRLIKDQKIQFHTHHRGGGQPDEWGNGVHLHKKLIGGPPRGKWEMIFPLDDDSPAIWRGPGMTAANFDSIRREVLKALKSHDTLADLKREIVQTVARFTPKGDQHLENVLANARAAAQRIARHFDLDPSIIEEVVRISRDHVSSYAALVRGGEGGAPYVVIAQDVGRVSLFPKRQRRVSDRAAFSRRCPWPGTPK